MEDNKFWLGIWKTVAVCFCVLLLTISGCGINTNYTIETMVKNGADPIKVACVINGMRDGNAAICAMATNK